MLCKVKYPFSEVIFKLENHNWELGNSLIDTFNALFDTILEVCELILIRFCSSIITTSPLDLALNYSCNLNKIFFL